MFTRPTGFETSRTPEPLDSAGLEAYCPTVLLVLLFSKFQHGEFKTRKPLGRTDTIPVSPYCQGLQASDWFQNLSDGF